MENTKQKRQYELIKNSVENLYRNHYEFLCVALIFVEHGIVDYEDIDINNCIDYVKEKYPRITNTNLKKELIKIVENDIYEDKSSVSFKDRIKKLKP